MDIGSRKTNFAPELRMMWHPFKVEPIPKELYVTVDTEKNTSL